MNTRARRAGREDFGVHVETMMDESQGILVIKLRLREEVADLYRQAQDGDAQAVADLSAISSVLRIFYRGSETDHPVVCLTCGASMNDPAGIVLVHPEVDLADGAHAISGVVCKACCTTAGMKQRMLDVVRECIFPGGSVREIAIHRTRGNA